ncbi:MAG: ferredoxin-type protein NapF [Candidatus Competibacterales bacterium]|nr:ferredoxin-type protein NapF [Candidatus Competibacterales bacterium]
MTTVDIARRAWLRGQRPPPAPLRPPWALSEAAFTAACSRCQACVEACPEGILLRGDAGFPTVDFRRGECTFCGCCVQACPEPAFGPVDARAWRQTPQFGEACLAQHGVVCHSCRETCEAGAIRLRFAAGRVPQPELDADACTGCGACVAVCPVDAVSIVRTTDS